MKYKQLVRILMLGLLLSSLALWGCLERSLTFQVRYAAVSGLKKNDAVYFQRNKVGEVKNVFYTQQGDYLVKVEIWPEFENAATEDSKFYIGFDPTVNENKALFVVQERPGGKVLQDDCIVRGSNATGYLEGLLGDLMGKAGDARREFGKTMEDLKKSFDTKSEQLDSDLEGALDDLFLQFHKLKKEISKVPDSREVQQLQESFKQFAEQFRKEGEKVQDNIRNKVIPGFQRELDRLREQLKQEGREKELEPIDKEMQEMTAV